MSAPAPVERRTSASRIDRLIPFGLALLALIVFARTLPGDFLNWDDWQMVSSNPDLRPAHWAALLAYWHRPHLRLFTPLTYWAYGLLEALSIFVSGKLQPCWFHGASLALHMANGLALWKILTRLSGDSRASAIGAAIFLVHPLQVEAVAWISSLNTLLAALMVLLSLRLYLRSIELTDRTKSHIAFAGCCLTSIIAMLAKPSACVLPAIAITLHALDSKRSLRNGVLRCLVICLLQAPFVLIAHAIQGGDAHPADAFNRRFLVALDALGFYIKKVFVPTHLAFDYGRSPSNISPGLPMALGVAFLVILLVAGGMRRFPRRRWVLAGMVVFLAALLPVLGLVPFDFQFYSTVADRYAYLAMIGPAMIVANLLTRRDIAAGQSVAGLPIARLFVAAFILAASAAGSFVQSAVWTSDARLFENGLAVNPNSIAANQTLGFLAAQAALQARGDTQRRDRLLSLAMTYDNRALAVNPDNPRARFNRANLFLRMGDPSQSLPDYAAASGTLDDEAKVQNNWGIACLQLNQLDQAATHFNAAIAADPAFADAYANAGIACLRAGQLGRARERFRQALALDPNQPQALAATTHLK